MTPPIDVPKEWIEGLLREASKFSGSRSSTRVEQAMKLSSLLAYIKSAESFLKEK